MAINLALECACKKIQEDFGLHVFPYIVPCAVDCKLLDQNINTKHASHAKAIMETGYGAKVDNGLKGRSVKLTTFLKLIQIHSSKLHFLLTHKLNITLPRKIEIIE
jgi:hypothetical protein